MKNALAVIGAIALTWGLSGLTPNISRSERVGLYRMTNEPLIKGTFVMLAMPMKRIVGVPGDTVHGRKLGPYEYWLEGDGPNSWDSRQLGPIPESLIISTAEPVFTPSWLQ